MIEPFWGELFVSPIPLELSLHYCSHGCHYCFANLNQPDRRADVKAIMRLLQAYPERDTYVAKLLQEKRPICISNKVDPFAATNWRVTLPLLESLVAQGFGVCVQTKGGEGIDEALGILPPSVWYVSLSLWDEQVRTTIEPGAPTIAQRLDLMHKLTERGHAVILGLNPLVPEWLPDPEPLLMAARDAGAVGCWVELVHFNYKQVNAMSPRGRVAMGEDVIRAAQKRCAPAHWWRAFTDARQMAADIGLDAFSIGQGNASNFWSHYRAKYSGTFPVYQDLVNAAHNLGAGEWWSWRDTWRCMTELYPVPQGKLKIGHYIGAKAHQLFREHTLSNWMTFAELSSLIWQDQRIAQCPALIPGFAFASQEGELLVDDDGLPWLVFDPSETTASVREVQ